MLTGLFGASSGSAEVFGIDIFNNMETVRQVIGICP
jgi:ABC-type multidrug transport system ATPase subunit